jgi:AraC-like DNA-binding protein
MNPFKEIINYPIDNSFVVKFDNFPHFRFPLHFHDEFEIVYIIKSFGKKFAGDAVEDFGPGDLSIFGSNLPHFYMNDPAFYRGDPDLRVNAIVIQFPATYFPESQLQTTEFTSIKKLLNTISCGLVFPSETVEVAGKLIVDMYQVSGIERYVLFVKLLDYLGKSESRSISTPEFSNLKYNQEDPRMARIYKFTSKNYNRKISLDEVASLAGMNATAFCRYFRKKSGKTFAQFINEQIIGFACKYLKHGNQTIAEISEVAGFNNLSNFNRQFKNILGKSPSEYRELFRDK